VCVRLEGDGPMVEEFEMSLWLAAGRDIWRGTALVTPPQFTGDFFWLLFQFVAVKCSVVCVVCVCGGVRFDTLCTILLLI